MTESIKQKLANCQTIDGKNEILRWADLCWADLRGANLIGANLRGADLCWADLSGADLCWADLKICGKWACSYNSGIISIGCKRMPLNEWHSFFAGTEEFETQRGTFEFFEIEHNFRWFCEMLKKYPKEFGVK